MFLGDVPFYLNSGLSTQEKCEESRKCGIRRDYMVKCVRLIAVRVEIGMPHLMAGDWAIGAMLPNPSSRIQPF